MAVKIRLRRMGAHKKPFYRIVVADSRSPRDGKCIEELGYYNPMVNPAEVKLDLEKAQKWIATGAQPTEIIKSLINNIENPKTETRVKKSKKVKAAEAAAKEAAAKATTEIKEEVPVKEESKVKAMAPEVLEEPKAEPEVKEEVKTEPAVE